MKVALKYSDKFNIKKNVDYSVRGIKKICEKIGPRAPGSPEEHHAQKWMAADLKNSCESVKIEDFQVHRQAFMGFIPFTVACAFGAAISYWFFSPLLSIALIVLGFIPFLFEFVMYKRFIDRLFKAHTSHNVEAIRRPKGEVKQRFIMVGHADSQYEWTLNYLLGGVGMKLILIPAVVGLVVDLVVAIVGVFTGGIGAVNASDSNIAKYLMIALLVFLPFQLAFLLFQSFTRSVPGANDNLSGCYVGMSVLKALDEADVRFGNTEVVMICSGSEEAGLRGAKAYVEKHLDQLKGIDTCVVALDTFRDLKDMAVYDRDLSGTLQHDLAVKTLVHDAAKNCGRDLPYSSIYLGGSDAAAFTQAGIPATGFAAMDPTPPRYYHTRLDGPELLEPEAIGAAIEIMLETVCMYDNKLVEKNEAPAVATVS